jgi:MFS family permease
LLLFLTFLNILSFVDRQLIVYLAPMLRQELGLSLAKIALLYGYVFLVFYTVMGMLLGNAADRFNRPRLIEPSADDSGGCSTTGGEGSNALSLGLSKAGSSPQDWPPGAIYGIGFGGIRR